MISTKNFIPLLRFPGIRQLTAVNMSISQQKKNIAKCHLLLRFQRCCFCDIRNLHGSQLILFSFSRNQVGSIAFTLHIEHVCLPSQKSDTMDPQNNWLEWQSDGDTVVHNLREGGVEHSLLLLNLRS